MDLTTCARAGFDGKPNTHANSSPAWYAHAIGAHLQATGRPEPRDVRMGRGYRIWANDMLFRETGPGPTFERER